MLLNDSQIKYAILVNGKKICESFNRLVLEQQLETLPHEQKETAVIISIDPNSGNQLLFG